MRGAQRVQRREKRLDLPTHPPHLGAKPIVAEGFAGDRRFGQAIGEQNEAFTIRKLYRD